MQVSGVARVSATTDGRAVMEVAGRPTFEMNKVAMNIWTKLVAGYSPREISSQVAKEFGVSEELTTKDVARFIDQLKRHLLIYDDN